jgi:Zn-dependent protease/CBS domain-containing protein
MGWSLNLGTIAGTTLRVHVLFLLLLVWVWIMHFTIGGAWAAWEGVLFVIAVFACVVLHEFGHIAAARYYGIRTPDITLLPIGGVARLERIPEKPVEEIVVALAGPLVNVVIAALIFFYLGRWSTGEELVLIEDPRLNFLARLAAINVFLVLFNLIPAFPMDGGRVLRAVLAIFMPWWRATQIAATIGQGLAFVFGFLGLLYNPLLILIAVFVYLAAAAEAQNAQLRDVASSLLVRDVMITDFATLERSATIEAAVEKLLATTQHEFPVVSEDGRFAGLLTRNDIIKALKESGASAPVVVGMRSDIPVIDGQQSLRVCLRLMQEKGAPAVAVTARDDRLVGLMTFETLGEMLMVRSALADGFRFGRLRREGLQTKGRHTRET